MSAKVIKIIQATELRGNGTQEHPYRNVTQYFTLKGELLWEVDPYPGNPREIDEEEFIRPFGAREEG